MTFDKSYSAAEEKGLPMSKRLAPHLRALDSREEKLDTLLENFNDARDPGFARSGIRGGDGGDGTMPLVWNMSYRELERSLKRMRTLAETPGVASPNLRACYVHLGEWYLRCRRKRMPLMRKDKRGRPYHVVTAGGPQFVISTVRDAHPGFVLQGLEWISQEFVGEVYLPKEFLEAA